MKKKKRLFSLLLALFMVLGLLPIEPFTITAKADWIDPDDFAVCQFCGEIYDNTVEGCYFCGLHDPCLEDNLDEEEVQAHFENCVSGGMGFCEECWEIVEFDCDCGWHGGDENGEGGHGLNNDVTFADHFALCITEFEEFTCDDCGLDPFSDEGWISFDESEWCATCGCHLECYENADPDSFTQTELYHAVGCENLQQCQICYQLFHSDTLCEDCGWHEDSGCVPLEEHQEMCLGWIFCDACGECHDPEEVEICDDCMLCEEAWEECPACGAPCNCQCVDEYCEVCNSCPNSDQPICDTCDDDDHNNFHECEENRCPDCDMCEVGREMYYGTLECEVENCDNNGNCPCLCEHFGDDFDPDEVDLSTRYDIRITVTNGDRALSNVPVYYQYGGKNYFLGFTGPDGVAEGNTTIMDGAAPDSWVIFAGRGGLTKTGGGLYKTAGPKKATYQMRSIEWRDIYDVTADMVMERYTVEGVDDDGTWDLYVIPTTNSSTKYEEIGWLTQNKLDKQIEKVQRMGDNKLGYGGADPKVEEGMTRRYGVRLYPLDSSGTLTTMSNHYYYSAKRLTANEAPGLVWYIPNVPYGEYLAIVYLPGYKPYVTSYTHYPVQEMEEVRPCELYAHMSSAGSVRSMEKVDISKTYDLIGQTRGQALADPIFVNLVNNATGRSVWAVTEPNQPDVFYFNPSIKEVGGGTYTVSLYYGETENRWYLDTIYEAKDGNLYPYEAVKNLDDDGLNTDITPGIVFFAEGKPLRSGQKVKYTIESADAEQQYAVNITSPDILGLYDGRLFYASGKGYTYTSDGSGETIYLCNYANSRYYNGGFGLSGKWKLTASLKGYGNYEKILTAADMEAITNENGGPLKINFNTEENGTGVFFSQKLPSTADPYIIGEDDKSKYTYTVQADGYVKDASNSYKMRLHEWYRSATEAAEGAWRDTVTWGLTTIGMDGEYTVTLPFSKGGGEYMYQVDFYINNKKVASSNVLKVKATPKLANDHAVSLRGMDITSFTNEVREYTGNENLYVMPGQSTALMAKSDPDIRQLVFREEGNEWELYGEPDDSFAEIVSSDNYSVKIRGNKPGAGTLDVNFYTLADGKEPGVFMELYVVVPVNKFNVTIPEPAVGKAVSECQAVAAKGCTDWYNVETIWHKGSKTTDTVMAPTDTFAGQQEYTVEVVFKAPEDSCYYLYAQDKNDGSINGETVQAYGSRDYDNFISNEVNIHKTYSGMHDENGVYVDSVEVTVPTPKEGTTINDLMEKIKINSYYENVTLKEIVVIDPLKVTNTTPLIARKRYELLLVLETHDVGEHDSFFTVGGTSIVNGVSDTFFTSEYNKNDEGEPYTTCWVQTSVICGGDSDVVPVDAMFLVPEKNSLQVGESTKINVYAYPENHTDTIEWNKLLNSSYFDWDEETMTVTAKGIPPYSPTYILEANTVHGNANVTCSISVYDGTEKTYSFTAKDTRVSTDGDYLPDGRERGSTVCIYPDYSKVPSGCILTGYTITDDDTGETVDISVKENGVFHDKYYWLYMPARNITATPIYTPTKSGDIHGTIYSSGATEGAIRLTLTNTSTNEIRKQTLYGGSEVSYEFKNVSAGTWKMEIIRDNYKDYVSYQEMNGDKICNVHLYAINPTKLKISIKLNKTKSTIYMGESEKLIATVDPADSTVTWSSGNTDVATVDENGIVSAVSPGMAKITATSEGKSASCTVKVQYVPVSGIKLNKSETTISVGNTEVLKATVEPENATDKEVIWTSDNESVATVDKDGKVTAISPGAVKIKATVGELSASCIVTVEKGVCEHTGGTNTCTEQAICSLCGQPYGELLSHSYQWVTDKAATTSAAGSRHEECSICGFRSGKMESIPMLLSPAEEKVSKKLGLTPEGTKEITAFAAKNKIPTDVLYVTEKTITTQKSEDVKAAIYSILSARATSTTKNKITLKWNKVKGADGYTIYSNQCGTKNKYKKITSLSNKKTSYSHSRLKKGAYYKYLVVAYKLVDGKKVTIQVSKTIHATTTGGKYGNAKSVKVSKTKVTVKKNKSYTLKASEVKKDKKINIHRKIAFESSNPVIATVSSKGKITGKKKGTCYIYAYAHNGVYSKVKVTVK